MVHNINSFPAFKKLVCQFGIALSILAANTLHAQTLLIDPAGDGGFENGSGFIANGWTLVNGPSNTWHSSNVGTPFEGNNHAFITNDGGLTYGYSNVTTATNHFYRDVVVPADETIISLSFQYKNVGEAGWDRVLVYAAPTSVIPTVGIPASNSTVLSGATLVYTGSGAIAAYTAVSNIALPATFAGTTMRLIFVWQNDSGGGTSPGGAVDNISLTSAPPSNYETSQYGGLWSSPASWVGGVVPANGNDVTVVAGSTLTVDASTYSMRDIHVNGLLNFGGTAATNFTLTVARDLTVAVGGTLLAHNLSMNQSTGTGINLGRDMHINGIANLACLNLTCIGAGASGVSQTIDGTGTIYGNGGKGLIRALLAANTLGTVTI
ncbi:MAG: G8 domain-containing protein, partial [Flavobacteriales bacterium]